MRILIVGLFDGLGGLRIAFRKLNKYVVVMCYVSSEVDKVAKRVVRKHWPGVLEWGSVEAINDDIVGKLSHVLSTQIDHVVIGGGLLVKICQALMHIVSVWQVHDPRCFITSHVLSSCFKSILVK